MSGHTPGPWRMSARELSEDLGYCGHSIYASGLWIASVMGNHVNIPIENIEPNARLIAAAPDLLAIAKRALNESARVRPDFAADIKAAIAAAEGDTT